MARQGTKRNHFAFGFPMVGLFLAVLLFSSQGWAVCTTGNYAISVGGYTYCKYGPSCASNATKCKDVLPQCTGEGCDGVKRTNSYIYTGVLTNSVSACFDENSNSCTTTEPYNSCHYSTRCTDECDLDSLACTTPNTWVPGTNGECGRCEMPPDDDDVCQAAKQSCLNLRGRFSGHALKVGDGYCCSGTCDMCNSLSIDMLFNVKRQVCCNRLEAPPKKTRMCFTPLQSGCGVTTSSIVSDDNEWTCTDPNQDAEAQSWFNEVCSPNYSSGGGDGDESSSSGDTPNTSTSDTPNTSTSDTPNTSTSDTPNTSTSEEESSSSDEDPNTSTSHPHSSSSDLDSLSSSSFSSSSFEELCPECDLLDSVLKIFDSMQTQAEEIFLCLTNPGLCPALDSPDSMKVRDSVVAGLLSDIRQDLQDLANTLGVSTDSVVAEILRGIQSDLQNSNDTTRKWLKIIADSIGVSTDSLAAHLDSILKHIPDSVLDSIVKYQKYASDNFDSVLYGSGKGFSLVDSLIDSAVKYFQISGHYDSIYHILFADSMGSIHGEITDIPERIAYYLGYGDTASTDLHGDLNGIKDAINGLGDGLGASIAAGLDSAWGDGTAPGDTVGDGPYGGFEDNSDSVGNAYIRTLGGLVDSAINDASFDTIFAAPGDTVGWDTAYTLPDIDSLKDHLDSGIFAQRAEIGDSLQASFDSLKDDFMLLNYDSLILAPLGMRVPNTNACPEDCFMFDIGDGGEGNWMSSLGRLDFGICKNLPGLGINVLYLIRLIGRIFTAMFCIYIGLWFIAGRKN